eukprot:TRINITY_DN6505_c0_g1_i2.p1 TRINITY_DN6505_c0_g1~~TRINITY_DN6505_c0_g1_i2.p1  ORF type:complete len:429 (+),score=114.46 TRINITY_DN6505_c0_g1_i2:104-1288(+)
MAVLTLESFFHSHLLKLRVKQSLWDKFDAGIADIVADIEASSSSSSNSSSSNSDKTIPEFLEVFINLNLTADQLPTAGYILELTRIFIVQTDWRTFEQDLFITSSSSSSSSSTSSSVDKTLLRFGCLLKLLLASFDTKENLSSFCVLLLVNSHAESWFFQMKRLIRMAVITTHTYDNHATSTNLTHFKHTSKLAILFLLVSTDSNAWKLSVPKKKKKTTSQAFKTVSSSLLHFAFEDAALYPALNSILNSIATKRVTSSVSKSESLIADSAFSLALRPLLPSWDLYASGTGTGTESWISLQSAPLINFIVFVLTVPNLHTVVHRTVLSAMTAAEETVWIPILMTLTYEFQSPQPKFGQLLQRIDEDSTGSRYRIMKQRRRNLMLTFWDSVLILL